MAERLILTTLRTKRAAMERHIKALEETLEQARIDLSHVNATLRLFELDGGDPEKPFSGRHMGTARLCGRGELLQLCREALEKAPDGLDTRQLAIEAITSRGMNPEDKALRSAVVMASSMP